MSLEIDGSYGEGGGQILRTSLSLSILTGTPFRIRDIRCRRKNPGLQRQHLAAVKAARKVSGAEVEGAEPGLREIVFAPGAVRSGNFEFDVGSAGSTTLVFQTLLPALLAAPARTALTLLGGTHNPLAPTADFITAAFLPALRRMGADVSLGLERHGFYPAGGGCVTAMIRPAPLRPLVIDKRGDVRSVRICAVVSNLPHEIATREVRTVAAMLEGLPVACHTEDVESPGPGNAVWIAVECEQVSEVFTAFGRKGVRAEEVARQAAQEALDFLAGRASVGPYLSDQLLLPMVVSGGGKFLTAAPTGHLTTNAHTIGRFLGTEVRIDRVDDTLWSVEVPGVSARSFP